MLLIFFVVCAEYLHSRFICLGAIARCLYPDSTIGSLQRLQPTDDSRVSSSSWESTSSWICWRSLNSRVSPSEQNTPEESSGWSQFIARLRNRVPILSSHVDIIVREFRHDGSAEKVIDMVNTNTGVANGALEKLGGLNVSNAHSTSNSYEVLLCEPAGSSIMDVPPSQISSTNIVEFQSDESKAVILPLQADNDNANL
jgi:hypothetical protein